MGRLDEDRMMIWIAGEAEALRQFLRLRLEMENHDVECLRVAEAVSMVGARKPDLLILDLPSLDLPFVGPIPTGKGTDLRSDFRGARSADLVASFRLANSQVPMLVLSASREIETRVMCLDRGADDCMIKPLSLSELRARCRALLRRQTEASLILRWEGVELNRMSHRVEQEGRPVVLTRTEFAVLEALMMQRGSCVSREALLARVWTGGQPAEGNIVDVYINYLRRKLGAGRAVIQTVRGRGYRAGAAPELAGAEPGMGATVWPVSHDC